MLILVPNITAIAPTAKRRIAESIQKIEARNTSAWLRFPKCAANASSGHMPKEMRGAANAKMPQVEHGDHATADRGNLSHQKTKNMRLPDSTLITD